MYTQAQFLVDLEMIQAAAESSTALTLATAVTRGRTLMRSAGATGNVVSGGNRERLASVLTLCESNLNSVLS